MTGPTPQPSALLLAAQLAATQQWQQRVWMAVADAAVDILAEAADAPLHDQRAKLARAVIRGDMAVLASWPRLVLSNETIRAAAAGDTSDGAADTVSDGDLQFTVASLWNSVATSLNL